MSVKDVAARSGVSFQTTSKVLNGGGSPGKVIGVVGSLLMAVVVNAFVRERIRFVPTQMKQEDLIVVTGLIEAGKLRPVLDRTYSLAATAEGLRRVEAGHVPGKLVIAVG